MLSGKVIGSCLPKHRHSEFLKFLKVIDAHVPPGLQVHLILDNSAIHKHPRFHLHFTPTSNSWLNLVERWSRELTDKALRRGVFHSVPDLITAVTDRQLTRTPEAEVFAAARAIEHTLLSENVADSPDSLPSTARPAVTTTGC